MKQKIALFLLLPVLTAALLVSCVRESPEPRLPASTDNAERSFLRTVETGPFLIALYSDHTAEITEVDKSYATSPLIVPEAFEDYRITAIGENTFFSSACREILLPDGIESIGRRAFQKSALERITLPAALCELGEEAFDNCRRLSAVTFSSSLKTIPVGAFFACAELGEIILPEGVERIEEEAFADCTGLQKVVLPESLRAIGPYAFWNCKHPDFDLTVPEGVETIGENAFEGTVLSRS